MVFSKSIKIVYLTEVWLKFYYIKSVVVKLTGQNIFQKMSFYFEKNIKFTFGKIAKEIRVYQKNLNRN